MNKACNIYVHEQRLKCTCKPKDRILVVYKRKLNCTVTRVQICLYMNKRFQIHLPLYSGVNLKLYCTHFLYWPDQLS